MTTLLNFPFRNQLAAPAPSDGQADENRTFNCGEADVSAIIEFFVPGLVIPPDDIKDALFGQGSAFVPSQMDAYRAFFAARKLPIAISDLPMSVATVRSEIDAGHPVVLLIPSSWGLEPPNPATEHSFHFVVAYSYDATQLSCMNPWGGFQHSGSFGYWQERLRGGAVWSFSKVGTSVAVDTTGLGSGFAAFATAHGLSCVSAGEHEYARDAAGHGQTFAAFAPTAEFPDGVILFYNAANGELTPTKAPWVATALWQRGEAIRVQAIQEAAKASSDLAVAQAQAQKARDDLAAAQAQAGRLAAQVTQLQAQIVALRNQPPAPPAPPAAPDAQLLDDAAVGRAFRLALARSGFHADLHGSATTPEGAATSIVPDPAA